MGDQIRTQPLYAVNVITPLDVLDAGIAVFGRDPGEPQAPGLRYFVNHWE
jgi:hypothetical protein